MSNYPNTWTLPALIEYCKTGPQASQGGPYVPARPMGFSSLGNRLRCAWLVFTGRADAVTWELGQ